jgi:MFS family permease
MTTAVYDEPRSDVDDELLKKVYWRIVPVVSIGFLIAFLDRSVISFAALQMNQQIGLSSTSFALGAGLFFLFYIPLEIPSNLILQKVGARIWFGRIMISWGLVTCAMAFINGATSYYIMRMLLGIAEAGYAPGVYLYLTYWFPAAYRAKAVALFTIAIPISSVIGGPLAGAILSVDGFLGLEGWRWLFVIEGIPAIVLGLWILRGLLSDRPATASWLQPKEREILTDRLAREERARLKVVNLSLLQTFANGQVLRLALANALWVTGYYGAMLWLPQIIKGFGMTNFQVGLVSAIPALISVFAMLAWARHSDRMRERRWHSALANIVGCAGLLLSVWMPTPLLALAFLTVGLVGLNCFYATFWALPQSILSKTAAAGGLALIGAIGNLGGFAGPYIVGWLHELLKNFDYALIALGIFLLASAITVLTIQPPPELDPTAPRIN